MRLIGVVSGLVLLILGIIFAGPLLLDYLAGLRYGSLVADLSSEDALSPIRFSPVLSEGELGDISDGSTDNLTPSSSIATEEFQSILAVSTGEVFSTNIYNSYTNQLLSKAAVLKMVSRDETGSVEVVKVLIRSVLVDDSRDVASGFTRYAAGVREIELSSADTANLSEEELQKIFPKGSRWYLTPLLSAEYSLEDSFIQDYLYHASLYYGSDFSEVQSYLDSGLTERYRGIIFLADLTADIDSLINENR